MVFHTINLEMGYHQVICYWKGVHILSNFMWHINNLLFKQGQIQNSPQDGEPTLGGANIRFCQIFQKTRMHSSRIHTICCSSHLGGCLPGGRCQPSRLFAQSAVCQTSPPPCGQNDRCLWKHYLATTMFQTVKMHGIDPPLLNAVSIR